MKKNMKAYILIDAIVVLSMILCGMIEYGLCTFFDFHYPTWGICPAALRGATMNEAITYYIMQPWWWISLIAGLSIMLYAVPKVVYPALCNLEGREK